MTVWFEFFLKGKLIGDWLYFRKVTDLAYIYSKVDCFVQNELSRSKNGIRPVRHWKLRTSYLTGWFFTCDFSISRYMVWRLSFALFSSVLQMTSKGCEPFEEFYFVYYHLIYLKHNMHLIINVCGINEHLL